jgi:hypothetical protein
MSNESRETPRDGNFQGYSKRGRSQEFGKFFTSPRPPVPSRNSRLITRYELSVINDDENSISNVGPRGRNFPSAKTSPSGGGEGR